MPEKPTKAQLRKALDNAAKAYGVKIGVEPLTELKALELAYKVLAKHEPELLDTPGAALQRKGAPELRSWELSNNLIADIDNERSRRKEAGLHADVRTICRTLSEREPWKTICANAKEWPEVLRQRYQRQRAGFKEQQELLEARKKALDAGDSELADKLWDKFIDTWEDKAVPGYWAGVHVFKDDEGNLELVAFKAENKSPKIPTAKRLKSKPKSTS